MAFVAPVIGAPGLSVVSCGAFASTRPARPAHAVVAAAPARRVGVSMNLFDRFFRVIRANFNKTLSGMEDPEKILDQTVADMQGDVVKVRQAYAEVSAGSKRLERQMEQAEVTSAEWKKRARLALQKGEEDLAREALTRKKAADDQVKSLTAQVDVMKANTEKLYGSMTALENKINEARSKKDEFVARARTAKTSQKVNDMLGNVGGSSALEAFERMKTKVEELEVKSDVSAEMMIGGSADSSLENKFKALESGSVDEELAALKGTLGMGNTPFKLSGSKGSGAPEIDDELEKMKRNM